MGRWLQICALRRTQWWYVSTVGNRIVVSYSQFAENLAAGTGDYTIADGVGDWAAEVCASHRTHDLI